MKRWWLFFALLIAAMLGNSGCTGGVAAYPRARVPAQHVVVDVSIFYDELAPYGRWFSLDDYGYVWTPYDVAVGWRPYTNGYWVYTDYGWTWVSQYRWGWAPFHYGRWIFHPRHGWVWRPGTLWGPAWVVWRHRSGPGRSGWVGWAPMPPQMEWRAGVGLHAEWGEINRIVEPFWYSFVEERNFTARDLDRRLELPARNGTLLREAENVTHYAWAENRVVNRSINIERVEQAIGRPVPRGRVADSNSPARGTEVKGNDVLIYRPTIQRETTTRIPRQEPPARKPDSNLDQTRRREEEEQRKLEIQQPLPRTTTRNVKRFEVEPWPKVSGASARQLRDLRRFVFTRRRPRAVEFSGGKARRFRPSPTETERQDELSANEHGSQDGFALFPLRHCATHILIEPAQRTFFQRKNAKV